MLGYLRLVRLPNVFTAMADILAAYTIMHASGLTSAGYGGLAVLAAASAALYLSGMAFNDVADREEDARVRPNRPIPSGQASLAGAAACGAILMLLGIGLAAYSGPSLPYAIALAVAILAYDFATKHVPVLGPVTLGFCRFFNVLLGAAVTSAIVFADLNGSRILQAPLAPALAVGIYAAGLTAFSAQEESGKQIRSIVTGWIFCGAALLIAGLCGHSPAGWIVLAPLTILLVIRTVALAREGSPLAARNLVRTGVMGVCALDAGLVLGFAGPTAWPIALACLALLIPSIAIAKWLAQKEA